MNNFVFGSDPLLYSQMTRQPNDADIRQKLDSMMNQYQSLQSYEQPQPKDYLGELDNILKGLDEKTIEILSTNSEFVQLNAYVQQSIQDEIMRSVKWKINSNQDVVGKVERLKSIVKEVNKEKENEDKKNLADLNDYIKNYSDLTFNEYKQLKQSRNEKI